MGALKAFISMLLELVQFGALGGDQSNYLHALRAGFMGGRDFLSRRLFTWDKIKCTFFLFPAIEIYTHR